MAILTKETSVTSIPLASLVALLLGWNLRGVVWHYLGVALACVPWWAWVWAVSGKVYLLGRLSPQLAALIGMAALVALGLGGLLYYSGLAHRLFSDEGRRRPVAWALTVAWVVLLSVLLLTTRSGLNGVLPQVLEGVRR